MHTSDMDGPTKAMLDTYPYGSEENGNKFFLLRVDRGI